MSGNSAWVVLIVGGTYQPGRYLFYYKFATQQTATQQTITQVQNYTSNIQTKIYDSK